MKDKLYKMMNWPDIEAIVYGEESNPEKTLGRQFLQSNTLFQTFCPESQKVALKLEGDERKYEMELVDEEGFYAISIPGKEKKMYSFEITDKEGKKTTIIDPYQFKVTLSEEEAVKWNKGLLYDAYKILGAHPMSFEGVSGVVFRVWAPNALRVSVVGEFNHWDGKNMPMMKDDKTDIFSIFIPELTKDQVYQYEIKIKSGEILHKNDPYSFKMINAMSVVSDHEEIRWKDSTYLTNCDKQELSKKAVNIFYMDKNTFYRKNDEVLSFKELADNLIPYLKEAKYTHIQFCPLMEESRERKEQIISFFTLEESYGSSEELKEFINALHKESIGVILEWIPAYFNKEEKGLCYFDGTYLYGHMDERMRYNAAFDGFHFNYARPQVQNYLMSNAFYWVKEFHVDGLHICGLSSMLYLDYAKKDGEWAANIYGGNENLDAIEFIKHLNSILHKERKGILTLTKETSAWPQVTDSLNAGGMGFDYIWNTGFRDDLVSYMGREYEERYNQIHELTDNMIYAYCEKYLLPIAINDYAGDMTSVIETMPGDNKEKEANLRLMLAFSMCHPGRKMMCSEIMKQSDKMINMTKTLNQLYLELPALHNLDSSADGFEWIQCINHNDGVISFLRKDAYIDETLLVICNFSNTAYNNYKFGIPFEGKYKEIFLSEDKQFGGDKTVTARYKESKEEDYDGRKNSLTLRIVPLSLSIYQYKPYTEEELLKIAEKKVEIIKQRLEKEAIKKANALKKMSLKEELEKKVTEADLKIAKGEEVQKAIKVTSRKKNSK